MLHAWYVGSNAYLSACPSQSPSVCVCVQHVMWNFVRHVVARDLQLSFSGSVCGTGAGAHSFVVFCFVHEQSATPQAKTPRYLHFKLTKNKRVYHVRICLPSQSVVCPSLPACLPACLGLPALH